MFTCKRRNVLTHLHKKCLHHFCKYSLGPRQLNLCVYVRTKMMTTSHTMEEQLLFIIENVDQKLLIKWEWFNCTESVIWIHSCILIDFPTRSGAFYLDDLSCPSLIQHEARIFALLIMIECTRWDGWVGGQNHTVRVLISASKTLPC
jgi:hypothetical protein